MSRALVKARAVATLARWLAPGVDIAASPDVVRGDLEGDVRIRVVRPRGRAPIGKLFVIPGIHYAGPDEPRLDRFLAVLAHAGFLVGSPFLNDFLEMRLSPRIHVDAERAFDAFDAFEPADRLGVMSISFGSLPALRLSASRPDRVRALLTFGGYADYRATLSFCLRGEAGRPHDPLNRPVVFLNLFHRFARSPVDEARLLHAWREFARATWGKPEMKARERYAAIAELLERDVHTDDLALFRMGVGLVPGGNELCDLALARDETDGYLDPRPFFRDIRCPVHVVHGRDDDVISHVELARIAGAFPPRSSVRTYLTGMYGHAQAEKGALRTAPLLAREVATLLRMLSALVDVGLSRP